MAGAAAEATRAWPEPDELGTAGRDAAAIGAALLPLHSSYGPDKEALFGH